MNIIWKKINSNNLIAVFEFKASIFTHRNWKLVNGPTGPFISRPQRKEKSKKGEEIWVSDIFIENREDYKKFCDYILADAVANGIL